jgi:hypothetical protein
MIPNARATVGTLIASARLAFCMPNKKKLLFSVKYGASEASTSNGAAGTAAATVGVNRSNKPMSELLQAYTINPP